MRVCNFEGIISQDTKVVIHVNMNAADDIIMSGNGIRYLDYCGIGGREVVSVFVDDDVLHLVAYDENEGGAGE